MFKPKPSNLKSKSWTRDELSIKQTDIELLQPRTLFLRSVDAALECMLIYFGMEVRPKNIKVDTLHALSPCDLDMCIKSN